MSYPNNINFVVGCIETSTGIGLSFGPVIGSILYEISGLATPFIAFFVICIITGIFLKGRIPEQADDYEEESDTEDPSNDISYFMLLSDRRIIFANMCVFLAVFQFAFIDPILASYMNKRFGIGFAISGYFFLLLGTGYTLSCFAVHITLRHVSNMRTATLAAILIGLFTIFYGPSNILQISPSMVILGIALFCAGGVNSHLVIPPMDEMITVGREIIPDEGKVEALNDLCSGLFNTFFALGEIFGPLLGNYLYADYGLGFTCDALGIMLIAFGILYFLT